nr:hypothetical protein [Nanoarchaeum sp.]
MVMTLYDRLKLFEKLGGKFDELCEELPRPKPILEFFHSRDSEVQKRIISAYENNTVLDDAINGRQSIDDSLSELAEINKGWKVMLPRRKNKSHNKKIEQLGELITEPRGLISRGLFYPDNAVSLTCYAAIAFTLLEKVALNYGWVAGSNPIEIAKTLGDFANTSVIGSLGTGLICGFDGERTNRLPHDQAKYLDEKISELYK